jgi:hypothetical protein
MTGPISRLCERWTYGFAVAIPQAVLLRNRETLIGSMPLKNVVPPTSDPAFMEI